jgi:ABC-type transporter Mla subunit MlaD
VSREAVLGFLVLLVSGLAVYLAPSRPEGARITGNSYILLMEKAEALRSGDMVKFAGVAVGRVTDLDFVTPADRERYPRAFVRVQILLDRSVRLPQNSGYSVGQDLFGGRYIDITPGASGEIVPPGSVIWAGRMPRVASTFEQTLASLRQLSVETQELREVVSDPKMRRDLKDAASNMRFYTRELAAYSAQARPQIARFRHNLDRQEQELLARLESFQASITAGRRRLVEMTPQLRESIEAWRSRLARDKAGLQRTVQSLLSASEQFEKAARDLEGRLPDPAEAARRVHKIALEMEDMADLAEDLHMITSDPEAQAELRALAERLRQSAERLKSQVQRWENTLNNFLP